MNNADLMNQNIASIQKSVTISYPKDEAGQFLLDTTKQATTLAKLEPHWADSGAGSIDELGVKSRQLREHQGVNETAKGTGGTTENKVQFNLKPVVWDEWIENKQVAYNARMRGQDVEVALIGLIQKQFGVDLQDLLFNGDTAAKLVDGVTKDPFLGIMDGFVKKMKQSTLKTDFGADDFTFADLINHTTLLDEKYLNREDLRWWMNRQVYQRLLAKAQQRETALGDFVLVNGELKKVAGFEIEVVQGLQGKFMALTPMANLVPVLFDQVEYSRVGGDSTAIAKKATYHNLYTQVDAVLRKLEAVAWVTGDKL